MMHPTIDIKTFLKPGVRAHLAGIGGVSMCPLAEVLLGMGLIVQGSDMTESDTVCQLRAQGIDVAGWLVGAMVTIALGGKLTKTLNEKFDAKWVKLLMAGCLVSLFTYLLLNTVYQKTSPYIAAAVFGAITMFVMNKVFRKNKRLQELSLGIAIIVGAALAQIFFAV